MAAFIGLIPLGHWEDEFATMRELWDGGWHAFYSRLVTWSPRPLSELLLYGYSRLIAATHMPLIGPALTILWIGLAAGLFAPFLSARRYFPSVSSMRQCLLLSLGLFCLFLCAPPVALFYWPQGAVAYLPVLAAICACFWVLATAGAGQARARWTCAFLLAIGAAFAEVGAMFILMFCCTAAAYLLAMRIMRRAPALPRAQLLWLAAPLAVAIFVLAAIYAGRVTTHVETFEGATIAHQFWPILSASVMSFLFETSTIASLPKNLAAAAVLGLGTAALFATGAYGILAPVMRARFRHADGHLLAFFSVSCFATSFLTIVAAYYQFGALCCERHTTFRQCLVYIGLAAGAAALAALRGRRPGEPASAAAPLRYVLCLMAAVLIPATIAAPRLALDYAGYRKTLERNAENWAAGMGPDNPMVYRQHPRYGVIGSSIVNPEGSYRLNDGSGWWIQNIIKFFDNKSITLINEN